MLSRSYGQASTRWTAWRVPLVAFRGLDPSRLSPGAAFVPHPTRPGASPSDAWPLCCQSAVAQIGHPGPCTTYNIGARRGIPDGAGTSRSSLPGVRSPSVGRCHHRPGGRLGRHTSLRLVQRILAAPSVRLGCNLMIDSTPGFTGTRGLPSQYAETIIGCSLVLDRERVQPRINAAARRL